jgi:hypothetical protein
VADVVLAFVIRPYFCLRRPGVCKKEATGKTLLNGKRTPGYGVILAGQAVFKRRSVTNRAI